MPVRHALRDYARSQRCGPSPQRQACRPSQQASPSELRYHVHRHVHSVRLRVGIEEGHTRPSRSYRQERSVTVLGIFADEVVTRPRGQLAGIEVSSRPRSGWLRLLIQAALPFSVIVETRRCWDVTGSGVGIVEKHKRDTRSPGPAVVYPTHSPCPRRQLIPSSHRAIGG